MTAAQKKLEAFLRKKKPPTLQLHKTIYALACLLKEAGWTEERSVEICRDYASNAGGRPTPPREISSAVTMAFSNTPKSQMNFPSPVPGLQAEVDKSPCSVPYPVSPEEPPEFFLRRMFTPEDLLCVGATEFAMDTRPLCEWEGMLSAMQFLVPSPMLSETGPRKQDGAESFHTEANTGPRKYLITEFDQASKPLQMGRVRSLEHRGPLPLVAIIDSGGKSLHAYWQADPDEATNYSFFCHACRLGADSRLWLRSQFARLPAGSRAGKRQDVLIFNLQ